eukprot:s1528_g5.t2
MRKQQQRKLSDLLRRWKEQGSRGQHRRQLERLADFKNSKVLSPYLCAWYFQSHFLRRRRLRRLPNDLPAEAGLLRLRQSFSLWRCRCRLLRQLHFRSGASAREVDRRLMLRAWQKLVQEKKSARALLLWNCFKEWTAQVEQDQRMRHMHSLAAKACAKVREQAWLLAMMAFWSQHACQGRQTAVNMALIASRHQWLVAAVAAGNRTCLAGAWKTWLDALQRVHQALHLKRFLLRRSAVEGLLRLAFQAFVWALRAVTGKPRSVLPKRAQLSVLGETLALQHHGQLLRAAVAALRWNATELKCQRLEGRTAELLHQMRNLGQQGAASEALKQHLRRALSMLQRQERHFSLKYVSSALHAWHQVATLQRRRTNVPSILLRPVRKLWLFRSFSFWKACVLAVSRAAGSLLRTLQDRRVALNILLRWSQAVRILQQQKDRQRFALGERHQRDCMTLHRMLLHWRAVVVEVKKNCAFLQRSVVLAIGAYDPSDRRQVAVCWAFWRLYMRQNSKAIALRLHRCETRRLHHYCTAWARIVREASTVMASPAAVPGRKVRTTADAPVPPNEALKLLKEGNTRFMNGEPTATQTDKIMRKELVDLGQAPHTAILGCADSRAPLETVFDAMPGDIFVLRNAGNTCTHAEGSMVGSLEFCTGKLGARLILVLGHTHCGAVYGATNAYMAAKKSGTGNVESALEGLLMDLAPVAEKAAVEMPHHDAGDIAAYAVRVNVFHTIDFLLKYSAGLREKVKSGQVEIQGGVYDLESGKVEFMGRSPQQSALLSTNLGLPPSMTRQGGRTSGYGPATQGEHGVRTSVDSAVPAEEALKMLKAGNERFAVGAPLAKHATLKMRQALVSHGQAPHTAILGCADSRVPVDTVFDAMPGDLFVLRNAGNTCTHAEGSMVGSLEFCCGKLGSKLILVMGHTKCGAIAGATATYLASKKGMASKTAGSALEGLLVGLSGVAKEAEEELGPGADEDQLVSHTVRVNVLSSIEFLLKYSPSLRELVKSGNVEIQGGIYHLETGRVEFIGRSPRQAELLCSDPSLPPSLQALPIRTTTDGPLPSKEALKLLKEGNARFTSGAAISGKITATMRKALVKEGQAPHTAIIGCADSRAPLETVFDAMPGDIFVLRNAGNTCTHAEGSMVGSLEFCLGALNTKMVLVLGHTACGAIKGATSTYLQAKSGNKPQVSKALDALLVGLSDVAKKASEELGPNATEQQIVERTIKLNVFHTIDCLLQYSPAIRQKVAAGEVEIQGGIYDLETGLQVRPQVVPLSQVLQAAPPVKAASARVRPTAQAPTQAPVLLPQGVQQVQNRTPRFTHVLPATARAVPSPPAAYFQAPAPVLLGHTGHTVRARDLSASGAIPTEPRDPRAATLPGVLRMAFLARFAVLLLECVTEAHQCTYVQSTLRQFVEVTKYAMTQGELHLQDAWVSRRSRWWCVLSHPSLGKINWEPFPIVSPRPQISSLIDQFKHCTPPELHHLVLDLYELGKFAHFGFDTNVVPWNGQMQTCLHSCGNQLGACPCGCRLFPFTDQRLNHGGLHGLLIPMPGTSTCGTRTYPNFRHISPEELALFSGMPPTLKWGEHLRLALCALGQLASPIQSIWIGTAIMNHVNKKFFGVECSSPKDVLLDYFAFLLSERDQVFGKPSQPKSMAFQTMVDNRTFEIPEHHPPAEETTKVPVLPAKACAAITTEVPTKATEDLKQALPADIRAIVPKPASEASDMNGPLHPPDRLSFPDLSISRADVIGGISGFESAKKLKTCHTTSADDLLSGPASSAVSAPTSGKDMCDHAPGISMPRSEPSNDVEVFPAGPVGESESGPLVAESPVIDCSQNNSGRVPAPDPSEPADNSIRHFDVWVIHESCRAPTVVKVPEDATVAQIALAEARLHTLPSNSAPRSWMNTHIPIHASVVEHQFIKLHTQAPPKMRCPVNMPDSVLPGIDFPCTRLTALWEQQAWVALDEMDFYLSIIQSNQQVNVIPCAEFVSQAAVDEETADRLHLPLEHAETDIPIITAIICAKHWIPIHMTRTSTKVIVFTTPEGEPLIAPLQAVANHMNLTFELHQRALPHSFDADCGFQTFAWLFTLTMQQPFEVFDAQKAEGWRKIFASHLLQTDRACQIIYSLPLGGSKPDSAHEGLKDLLGQHGVWKDRVHERADQILSKLGQANIQAILKSKRAWADLKSAANACTPPFKLIMPDELQAQITARTNAKKTFGMKNPKASKRREHAPTLVIHAAELQIPQGVFKQSDDVPLAQISHHDIGPHAKGVLLVDQQDSEAMQRLPKPVTSGGLALIVLANAADADQHAAPPIRFPALCTTTNEPLIASGYLYQLGQVDVIRHEPSVKLAVEQCNTEVFRCLVFKDQADQIWEDMQKQPVKTIFGQEPLLVPRQNESSTQVIDVWDRQWMSKRFERVKPQTAEVFAFTFRMKAEKSDELLQRNSLNGIYYEPRSQCGRHPSDSYHVTWLPQVSFQDAKYAQQTSPQTTTLTRHGDRYGLRCDTINASEVHARHRPNTPLLLGQDKKLYVLGPLPFSTTRDGVTKLLKAWKWDARALQPRGRAPDSSGMMWTIQGVEDPAYWIFNLEHGDVLVSRVNQSSDHAKPKQVPIIASKKTIQHFEQKETDPWLLHDPWKPSQSHAQVKNTMPAVASAALSTAQIATIESNLEKKLIQTIRQERAARSGDEDATMSSPALEQRVTQLEQHLQHVHSSQTGLECKVSQMQQQLDQQTVQFSHVIDQKLEQTMQVQMDRIEALLVKRSRLE